MANRSVKLDPTKRKPGAPLTDSEKDLIRKMIAEGATHSAICREVGIGSSTLSRFKTREGLTTDPVVDTRPAQAGFRRDANKKRAERQAAFDELFQWRIEVLGKAKRGEGYKTLVKIPGGGEITETLTYIPAADLRSEMAVLASLDQSINRNDDRADDGGLARAQSMLSMLLHGLSAKPIEVPVDQGTVEE